jgi:hypothetical protein
LPISGLNVNVPKNGNTSVFVEVTIVGTLPSGVRSLSFAVGQNDVRGRDEAGIDRYGPSSQLTWSASLLENLAGQAKFIGALNTNTPKQGYVVGSEENNGIGRRVKVLSFDLTAKSDNLMVTKITGSVTNTSTVKVVYIARPGQDPFASANPSNSGDFTLDIPVDTVTINRDQTATFDILVDLEAPSLPNIATFTVSISTTTGVNSLGDNISSQTKVTSEMMRAVRVGPRFAAVGKTISVSRDQNNSTTTVQSVVFIVNVTAVGGPLYVPPANTATITLEAVSGTPIAVSVAPAAVRVGDTPVSVDADTGYYKIPEGSTYQFEFRTSGQTFTGAQSVRARLSTFVFDNDGSVPAMDDSSFLHNLSEFWTNWSN